MFCKKSNSMIKRYLIAVVFFSVNYLHYLTSTLEIPQTALTSSTLLNILRVWIKFMRAFLSKSSNIYFASKVLQIAYHYRNCFKNAPYFAFVPFLFLQNAHKRVQNLLSKLTWNRTSGCLGFWLQVTRGNRAVLKLFPPSPKQSRNFKTAWMIFF